MNRAQRIFVSTAAIAFATCSSIEFYDGRDSLSGFDPATCAFTGSRGPIEHPSWEFFNADARDGMVRIAPDVERLAGLFEQIGYKLEDVRDGQRAVPRLMLASLPAGIGAVPSVEEKKRIFLATVLPAALFVNEKLREQRKILVAMDACRSKGRALDKRAQDWLRTMAALYDTDPKIGPLLRRVDTIPPSLLLAQAATESGWGTSRFAQQGNALFGEYTWDAEKGMRPADAEASARRRVRQFNDIVDSVVSYARNLNTHDAYAAFREARAEARASGARPDGAELAAMFVRYSTRRGAYVDDLRAIIRANRLEDFDGARLDDAPKWIPTAGEAMLRS